MPAPHLPRPPAATLSWTPTLLGAVAGAAAQVTQAQLAPLWGYQALLVLGGAALLYCLCGGLRQRGLFCVQCVAAASAAALVFGSTGWRAHAFAAQGLTPALEGRDIRVTGVVAALVQPLQAGGQRWLFAVEQARLLDENGAPAALPPLLELSWYAPWPRAGQAGNGAAPPAMQPGQRWDLTVRLKRPHGARNPHGFDYELRQWERGVQAGGYVRDTPPARLLAAAHARAPYWLQRQRQHTRDAILAQTIPGPQWAGLDGAQAQRLLGVVAALALGDQQAIAHADWDLFRRTGVAHLVSISGLHITLFTVLAAALVQRLWRCSARACRRMPARQAALLGGVLLALAYALFSGWGIPARRAVYMLAAVALLRGAGLRWPWFAVWSLALAVVVVLDPWALWQAGFWLSFVAVGVLLAFGDARAPQHAPARQRAGWASVLRWPVRKLAALWHMQWRISLVLAPLGLLLFGHISLTGLLANLLAIPWVTFVVTPLALAGAVWGTLWSVAALALAPLLAVLQWLGQWDWAVLNLAQPPLWAALVAIFGALALLSPLPRAWRICAAFAMLPALYWPPAGVPPGEFSLLAADIGQGNAVLLQTARHSLLYDSGPRYSSESGTENNAENNAGGRVLVPLLQALGVRLDALWLSHRDSDHTGGALAVHVAQPQATIWGSDSVLLDPALAALGRVQRCQAGQQWEWDGVRFAVLNPPASGFARAPPAVAQALRRANENSCVLLVRSASGKTALLAGDITAAQEHALVRAGALPPLDWLLVPHHGSKTSSSRALLQAGTPRWAMVQAGYRNRYGHPAPEVLQRYQGAGARVVQQAQCGAAHWTSSQPEELVCERLRQRRYWDVHAVPLEP